MSDVGRERTKLLNWVKRTRGQMDAIERALTGDEDCMNILMLLAAVRGGINGLMGDVLEDGHTPLTPDLGEELIDLVRAYLK
jgi:FrmR/RcnR family transcriptional regulator, repressor of rcnA expression